MSVTVHIVTLFSEMFTALQSGILGRAIDNGLINLKYWDPRDYSHDKHRNVDDRPYGGGPGMVMMVQPLQDTLHAIKAEATLPVTVIYLSPQGRLLDHRGVEEIKGLSLKEELVLLCGRYEGIDERLIAAEVDAEWSVGDYVLSGGEFAAMIIVDAITRLLPGALGDEGSAAMDSFATGLLDHPQYTRPELYGDAAVPSVLLSGNHEAIRKWRLEQSLMRTLQRRPQLLQQASLTDEQQQLLTELISIM